MAPRPVLILLTLLLVVAPAQGCLQAVLPGDDGSGGNDPGTDPGGNDGTNGDNGDPGTDPDPNNGQQEGPWPPELQFDGERALGHVRDQVLKPDGSVRYRVPGTQGRQEAADLIATALKDAGWTVDRQRWRGMYACEEIGMENVVGTLKGSTDRVLMLGAHYDSRPWADKEPNSDHWDDPVPGANDAGSGVGALLELARVLGEGPALEHTVQLVFFDAEDGGSPPPTANCDPEGPNDGWIIGSTHFVDSLSDEELERIQAFILLDMVGGTDLQLRLERYSAGHPHRFLQMRIWDTAEELGHPQFVNQAGGYVVDDHRPFQQAGVLAVDVIHLDGGTDQFPSTHHRLNDDMAHVSAESLEAVGRVVEHVVYDLDRNPVDPGF